MGRWASRSALRGLHVDAVLKWATEVSTLAIAMSFGFSALVGVVFGFVPARRAAALMPTEALAVRIKTVVWLKADFTSANQGPCAEI